MGGTAVWIDRFLLRCKGSSPFLCIPQIHVRTYVRVRTYEQRPNPRETILLLLQIHHNGISWYNSFRAQTD